MTFQISHQCPQCGAPAVLDEETLFFACEFCRVKSLISFQGMARYRFDGPGGDGVLFLPYWRFRGILYACTRSGGLTHRFQDISGPALSPFPPGLPASLGLRAQALPLKHIALDHPGRFLAPDRFSPVPTPAREPVWTRAIGTTRSLIFTPYRIRNGVLVDAILDQPTRMAAEPDFAPGARPVCSPGQKMRFIPGICPDCGQDLSGFSNSLVLTCHACHSLWKARDHNLTRIRFSGTAPAGPGDVMVPFWCISASLEGISSEDMSPPRFWVPALPLRPQIFLNLSARLTETQPSWDPDLPWPGNTPLLPVTLPVREALQFIPVLLARLTKPLTAIFDLLPDIQARARSGTLVFLPFESHSHEYVHPGLTLAINKNSLALSLTL